MVDLGGRLRRVLVGLDRFPRGSPLFPARSGALVVRVCCGSLAALARRPLSLTVASPTAELPRRVLLESAHDFRWRTGRDTRGEGARGLVRRGVRGVLVLLPLLGTRLLSCSAHGPRRPCAGLRRVPGVSAWPSEQVAGRSGWCVVPPGRNSGDRLRDLSSHPPGPSRPGVAVPLITPRSLAHTLSNCGGGLERLGRGRSPAFMGGRSPGRLPPLVPSERS